MPGRRLDSSHRNAYLIRILARRPTMAAAGRVLMAQPSIPNSARTRMALTYAMEEARALRHNYLGQEHILIGLTRVADSAAAHILAELGATEQLVRDAVIASVGHGTREVTGELGYSPRAKKAMQLAEERAAR